jgi:hypothetical protein
VLFPVSLVGFLTAAEADFNCEAAFFFSVVLDLAEIFFALGLAGDWVDFFML